MKLVMLLYLFLNSSLAMSEVFDTEEYCKNHPKQLMTKSKDKGCSFKILCNAGRVDLFYYCKKNREFYSFGNDKLIINERITSVYYNYPRLLFTTIIENNEGLKSRLLQGVLDNDSILVLLDKSDVFLKFIKNADKENLYKFKKVNCLKKDFDLKLISGCYKRSTKPDIF